MMSRRICKSLTQLLVRLQNKKLVATGTFFIYRHRFIPAVGEDGKKESALMRGYGIINEEMVK